jgi:hypothetical protein
MEQKKIVRRELACLAENRRMERHSKLEIKRILAELKGQRRSLDKAIAALESIAPRAQKRGKSGGKQLRRASKRRRQAQRVGRGPVGDPAADSGTVIPFRLPGRRARAKSSRAEEA